MNDNNLNNNDFQNSGGTYKATSNLNTAIENPQMNLDSVNSVNIKNLGYNNYANDINSNKDTNFLNNNINSNDSLENSNINTNISDNSIANNYVPNKSTTDNYAYSDSKLDTNNYSYEPVMKQKKREGDNPISNLLHSGEFKAMVLIVFILVLFLLIMPYIYDFIRNLQLSKTA